MTSHLRPGKYIEYDFPRREVNRLAQKAALGPARLSCQPQSSDAPAARHRG